MPFALTLFLICALLGLTCPSSFAFQPVAASDEPAQAKTLRIAVAANFKPTLQAINVGFEQASGIAPRLSSASTGVLATQITHGAPFDVFFAADRASAEAVNSRLPAFCYARGRLALVGGTLADLKRAGLSVAIANPVTAPYGSAALQVLNRTEFRSASQRTVVRGNNAAQAFQFWHTGAADLALVPLSLALPLTSSGFQIIPGEWHSGIDQYAAVPGSGPLVRRYLDWLRSDTVRSLILAAGYDPCP